MKVSCLIAMTLLAVALPSQALEQREFYSADKSKSFKAALTDYNAKTKTVTVLVGGGRSRSFKLGVLSTDCQQYVLGSQQSLTIGKSVRLTISEVKDKKDGDAVPTGYAIEVRNNGKINLDDVTLKYTLYYAQGDLKKGGTVAKTRTGNLTTGKMYSYDSLTVSTEKVDIVRKIKRPEGSG